MPVKSKVKISQNFVAFSEYMNFNLIDVNFHLQKSLEIFYTNPIPVGKSALSHANWD